MNQNLVSGRNVLEDKMPFWFDQFTKNVEEGAKVIMVPPTANLTKPIRIDLAETGNLVIKVAAEASVVICEVCSGPIGGAEVKLFIEQGAKVVYLADEVKSYGGLETGVVAREAVLAQDSQIDWFGATMHQTGYVTKIKSVIKGENVRSDMHWLHFTQADETVELELTNRFDAPNSRGKIFVKSVVQDRGRVKITGGIEITLAGQGTDSYLKEDVLLLGKEARAQTLPCLEIKTNDVKAGHGATVTNLKPDDLFYLLSRGVDPKVAQRLIVEGFLGSVLVDCPDQEFVGQIKTNLKQL